MKTFVLGDIHGAYTALMQCLERAQFDYRKDRLIVLGDVCDGWPQVKESIEELLKVRNLEYIIGNHDLWALHWARYGIAPESWLEQGGYHSFLSYKGGPVPQTHIDFLAQAHPWFVWENRLFVHGGFDWKRPLPEQDIDVLVWDRELLQSAYKKNLADPHFQFSSFPEIYVGHTPTSNFGTFLPAKFCNVWAMDTGAGWNGRLTIMDIDTEQYWQSDFTPTLYPDETGRRM